MVAWRTLLATHQPTSSDCGIITLGMHGCAAATMQPQAHGMRAMAPRTRLGRCMACEERRAWIRRMCWSSAQALPD